MGGAASKGREGPSSIAAETKSLESRLAGLGELPRLQTVFAHLAGPHNGLIAPQALQACFELGTDCVVSSELRMLVEQVASTLIDIVFARDNDGISWTLFLKGFEKCHQPAGVIRLNFLLYYFFHLRKRAELPLGFSLANEDGHFGRLEMEGFMTCEQLQDFLWLCWLIGYDASMGTQKDTHRALPNVKPLLQAAVMSSSSSNETEMEHKKLPLDKLFTWMLLSIPGLGNCLSDYFQARICRVASDLQSRSMDQKSGKQHDDLNLGSEQHTENISGRGLLSSDVSWAVGLSQLDTIGCRLMNHAYGFQKDTAFPLYRSSLYGKVLILEAAPQREEGQLEEILLNMLDILYRDGVTKIASCDYSQEEALNAVLRNCRWSGIDALSSIVENSLTWLQNNEERCDITEMAFCGLREMESYVLTEMVCMLRKFRPLLSKGDAMWCLLMCDMNVHLACSIDGDAMSSSVKDGNSPPLAVAQSKSILNPMLPNGIVTGVPLPQQTPRLLQTGLQPSNPPSVSSQKDNRSAFSTPSFTSSPIGKVAVASRKGNPGKTCISRTTHVSPPLTTCEDQNTTREQERQMVNDVQSDQVVTPQVPMFEQTRKPIFSKYAHGNHNFEKPQNFTPDPLLTNGVTTAETCALFDREIHVTGAQCTPCYEATVRSSVSVQSPSLPPDFTTVKMKGGSNFHTAQLSMSSDGNHLVQTDLQIGSTAFPGFQFSPSEAWPAVNASAGANSFASRGGAELSLATTPPAVNGGSETPIPSYSSDKGEQSMSNSINAFPMNRLLGCIDSKSEERKTEMLWQLADRVKELEAQLQEWTDWAQQKVMQAARRLTKDASELKALRQEREEYLRLKKEKQSLEENTMKKLSEMDTALRKALSQVDRANSTAWRLEAENAEVRAEMVAAKLTAAESVTVCQEATKREKKSMKKVQGWEKQKLKLQEELAEEKRKLSSLMEQLSQARERQQQAEGRWRQEKAAKEEALACVESEKRAKEQAECVAKRKEEELRRKRETESQRFRDELQRLETEIAKVKISSGIQPLVMKWGNGVCLSNTSLDNCSGEKLRQMNVRLLSEIADLRNSQRDVHRDRECVMCMTDEMSVVFLPCAHQVVCIKCNELHEREGLKDCPSCRTPIRQRIHVFGVRS